MTISSIDTDEDFQMEFYAIGGSSDSSADWKDDIGGKDINSAGFTSLSALALGMVVFSLAST